MGVRPKRIDLYIKSKTSIYYTQPVCRGGGKGWVPEGGIGYADAQSSEHTLDEKDSCLKTSLEALSKKYGFELNIHDLALKAEARRALFKGIIKTPVIVIDNRKIKDPSPEERLLLQQVYMQPSNSRNHYIFRKSRSTMPPVKMRKSTKYLKWMPVKFAFQLGLSFLTLLAIFRFIESRAASYTAIHDTLPFYVFILALLPCLSGLVTMMTTFLEMRFAETGLMRYLERPGIFGVC